MKALYKVDSTGALRVWVIESNGPVVGISHGILGGAPTYDEYTATPKNVGKKNETSGTKQAKLEVTARIDKQRLKGYYDTIGSARENAEQFKPMKIHKALTDDGEGFTRYFDRLPELVLVQRKYDGIWGGVFWSDDKIVHRSRGNRTHDILAHSKLHTELMKVLPKNVMWVGEVYCDGMRETDVGGLLRAKSISDERQALLDRLNFCVFDTYDENDLDYLSRIGQVYDATISSDHVEAVHSVLTTKARVLTYMEAAREQHWEGIVVRDPECTYDCGKRSQDVLKAVPFTTVDFRIQDITYDRNKDVVKIVFDGFEATYNRPKDEQFKVYTARELYIGQLGKVRHRDFTANGLPKFPKVVELLPIDITDLQ